MSREQQPQDKPTPPPPVDVRAFITDAYVARLKRLAARGRRAEADVRKLEQAREQEQQQQQER